MRSGFWILAGVVLGVGAPVQADEGSGLSPEIVLFKGRMSLGIVVPSDRQGSLGAEASTPRLNGLSLLGDYYFGRSLSSEGAASGFRATSGVLIGSRLGAWGGLSQASLDNASLSVERRSFSLLPPVAGLDAPVNDSSAIPYQGIGYTGGSIKGGWGFSADLGLMALNPGNAVRFGRTFGGTQSLDDLVRELRLSPVMQLGVSYSF